jgi:hypothetical protein
MRCDHSREIALEPLRKWQEALEAYILAEERLGERQDQR